MTITILVPVAQEPLTLDEVKAHLRLDSGFTSDDTYITALISEAREYGEYECRRAFAPQTIQALLDIPMRPAGPLSGAIGFRASMIEIPQPPVTSMTTVEGETTPGTFQVIDPVNYILDTASSPGRVYLLASAYSFLGSQWTLWIGPYIPRFRLTYQAGYVSGTIPFTLKRAMLELIAYWYSYREGRDEAVGPRYASKTALPDGIQQKFDKHKVFYL